MQEPRDDPVIDLHLVKDSGLTRTDILGRPAYDPGRPVFFQRHRR